MTIALYMQVDTRIMELVTGSDDRTVRKDAIIFDTIRREFSFLRDPALPKWWARDAMRVWITMAARWVEQEQRERTAAAGQVVDLRDWESAAKRFKSDLLIPVKHAFFIVAVRTGKEVRKVIVPFGDFLGKGDDGGSAGPRFKDLLVSTLWRLLREREGLMLDQGRDKLVVKKKIEGGGLVDIHLSTNFDLHTGVVWKTFDGSSIHLEIVSFWIMCTNKAMVC